MRHIHRFFFSLLLVFLPTQLGYHFWPDWATVLGRRIDYLSPTIYFTDVLIGLTLASWLFNEFSIFNSQFSIKGRNFQFSIFIFVLLFVGVNIYFAANPVIAMYKWIKVLEFVGLGYYIIKTKPTFSFVIWHLSFGILYSSLLAIAQFIFQHSIGGPLWFLGERTFAPDTPGIARASLRQCVSASMCGEVLRAYGTFPHPNVLGGFLAVTIPLLVNLQIYKSTNLQINSKIFKILKWTTITLGSVALVLTFSRSAIVVGVVATALVIARMRNKTIIFFYLFFAIVLLISFFKINPHEESVVVRQQLNNAAIKIWQSSPLVGVGLGNFLVVLPKALPSRTVYFLQPVHNIYLLLLSEVGVVGMGFFLWLLWIAIRNKGKVISKKGNFIAFSYLLSLISYLFLGLVDHYPLSLQQGQLMLTVFLALFLTHDT